MNNQKTFVYGKSKNKILYMGNLESRINEKTYVLLQKSPYKICLKGLPSIFKGR